MYEPLFYKTLFAGWLLGCASMVILVAIMGQIYTPRRRVR